MKNLFFSEFAVLKYYYLIFGILILLAILVLQFYLGGILRSLFIVNMISGLIYYMLIPFSINRTTKKKLLCALPIRRKDIVRYTFLKMLIPAILLILGIIASQFVLKKNLEEILLMYYVMTFAATLDAIISFRASHINASSISFMPTFFYFSFLFVNLTGVRILIPELVYDPIFLVTFTVLIFVTSYYISIKTFANAEIEMNSEKFHKRKIERRFEKIFLGNK